MSAELSLAMEVSKFAERNTYGIIKTETSQDEMLKLLNKQMIIMVLSDPICLEELTDDEQTILEGILTLNT